MISVVIPTYNRAALLRSSLESLAAQSLPRADYEVVVVDDGSTDTTAEVCQSFLSRMNLRYFRIANSGIAAAKNLGIFAAGFPIILFFDDDDIADPNLLAEHLKTHARYPLENVAVLGYTTWAPTLHVTQLMHYVTEIGGFLFSYANLVDGQILDFTYFWGGRSSCKKSLLVKRGVFNQQFRFSPEDIELGYRLSRFGLKVVFNRNAVQFMNRAVTFDEFCRRCEKQGTYQAAFARLHEDPIIEQYCQIAQAKKCWATWSNQMGMGFYRVREIEAMLECEPHSTEAESLRAEVLRLYRWTFNCFKMRGIVRAEQKRANKPHETENNGAAVIRPILIYQMGKVGSKSVEASLKALNLGVPVCHSHLLHDLERVEKAIKLSRLNPGQTMAEINHGRQLQKTILGTKYICCQVISLVRDPVARNISAFFENITEFIPDLYARFASGTLFTEDLVSAFLTQYDHKVPLQWFDVQLKPVFGIDVFAEQFPKERGYRLYDGANATLLVIKLERLKECVEPAMSAFLGVERFLLQHANNAERKEYGEIYKEFLNTIKLPSSYLDSMYQSKMVRHFYSDGEVSEFRKRWMKNWLIQS